MLMIFARYHVFLPCHRLEGRKEGREATKKVIFFSGQSTKRGKEGERGCPLRKKNFFKVVVFFVAVLLTTKRLAASLTNEGRRKEGRKGKKEGRKEGRKE